VEAGAELRVDYESGRSDYWRALGCEPPPETAWREVQLNLTPKLNLMPDPNPNPDPIPKQVRRATPPPADPGDLDGTALPLDGATLAVALPVATTLLSP